MTADAPLVEIRNATLWRGTTCVFEDLNLVIGQHERIAIVGDKAWQRWMTAISIPC